MVLLDYFITFRKLQVFWCILAFYLVSSHSLHILFLVSFEFLSFSACHYTCTPLQCTGYFQLYLFILLQCSCVWLQSFWPLLFLFLFLVPLLTAPSVPIWFFTFLTFNAENSICRLQMFHDEPSLSASALDLFLQFTFWNTTIQIFKLIEQHSIQFIMKIWLEPLWENFQIFIQSISIAPNFKFFPVLI